MLAVATGSGSVLGTGGCNWKRVGSVEVAETAGAWLVGPTRFSSCGAEPFVGWVGCRAGQCRVGSACDTDGSELGLETLVIEAKLTV